MSKIISAKDLVPNLYNKTIESDDDDDDDESDDHQSTNHEDVVDDLSYDVYNLSAYNYHPIHINDNSKDDSMKEQEFIDIATRSTQLLLKRIFDCPVEKTDLGPLAELPNEVSILPREKPVPQPKPETKWEKFAKEKGITKHKRERMLYDENSNEYRPRYGYQRASDGVDDVPIIEIKNGQDPYKDPWDENRLEKRTKIAKNRHNQENNKIRAAGGKVQRFAPSSVPGIPVDVEEKSMKRGKEGVRKALELVQHSTQSMGRFDAMREGEPKRNIKGKKRNFRDNLLQDDRDHMKAQLRIVEDKVSKKARGVTNSLKQYEGIIPDAPSNEFKAKKGHNKAAKPLSKKKPRKS